MAKWMRALWALVLATTVAACSGATDTSANNQNSADGGSSQDAGSGDSTPFVNHATKHASYAPNGYRPKDAQRLIVMGDSISVGAGSSSSSLAYYAQLIRNNDTKYSAETGHSLEAKFGHAIDLVNVAKSGATTNDLASQESKLDQQAPFTGHSIVTITIGGNDLQGALANNDPDPAGSLLEEALANIGPTIDFLQNPEKFPDGVSIYLMAVYDPTDGKGQANGCFFGVSRPQFIPALDKWREAYIDLAKEKHFAVVDALGHFHGHGGNYADTSNEYFNAEDNTRWFANDCIHPNDRGHSELRRLFFETIDWSYTATP
jgi:lysophospholipase L1-like esterase